MPTHPGRETQCSRSPECVLVPSVHIHLVVGKAGRHGMPYAAMLQGEARRGAGAEARGGKAR